MKEDGTLDAVIGGYQPWIDIYWTLSNLGWTNEIGNAMDSASFYAMLKKRADGDPDPATGQNNGISAAYKIEAVPAFVVPVEGASERPRS